MRNSGRSFAEKTYKQYVPKGLCGYSMTENPKGATSGFTNSNPASVDCDKDRTADAKLLSLYQPNQLLKYVLSIIRRGTGDNTGNLAETGFDEFNF